MADLTQFDLGSAARVARVVRHVEQEPPRARPLTFDAVQQQQRRVLLKLCKTTSDWEYDTIATLDVWHGGTPPSEGSSGETVEAVNKTAPVAANTFVLVGKAENGSWYLVESTPANVLLKLCKTTSEWGVGTTATLNVWHGGTPPSEGSSGETVVAVNKTTPVAANTFVLVGKAANGSWYLVEAGRDSGEGEGGCSLASRLTDYGLNDSIATTPLGTGSGPQVLMHNEGCLTWVSLTKITVLTSVALDDEDGLVFSRDEIWTFRDANSSIGPTEISTTDCQQQE
jgi:hypothetical protein